MLGAVWKDFNKELNLKRVCRCIRLLKTFLAESEATIRQNDPNFNVVKHGLLLRGEPVSIRVQRVGDDAECPIILTHTNSTIHQLRLVSASIHAARLLHSLMVHQLRFAGVSMHTLALQRSTSRQQRVSHL